MKTARYKPRRLEEPEFSEPANLTRTLRKILSSPSVASKEAVIRTYDHEVKGNTLLKPLQGGSAGPNDAAVIKPLEDSWKGITVSCGMNPAYGKIDPYWMAASAIDEAIRNNVAVGGRRLALLDNFTWGNPDEPDRLGDLVRTCQACYRFATAFRTPFISGKDSLHNESPLGPVTPTLLITAVGIVPDTRSIVSMEVKAPNNPLYMVGQTMKELGGSEYYRLRGFLGSTVPKVRPEEARKTFDSVTKAIDAGLVEACHDLSEGGLAVTAAEMALAGGYGIKLHLKHVPKEGLNRNDFILFSESNSRFLIEVENYSKEEFEALMKGCTCAEIGVVTQKPQLHICGVNDEIVANASVNDLSTCWKQTFSNRGLQYEA